MCVRACVHAWCARLCMQMCVIARATSALHANCNVDTKRRCSGFLSQRRKFKSRSRSDAKAIAACVPAGHLGILQRFQCSHLGRSDIEIPAQFVMTYRACRPRMAFAPSNMLAHWRIHTRSGCCPKVVPLESTVYRPGGGIGPICEEPDPGSTPVFWSRWFSWIVGTM
jgi:hypothetical protein